MRPSVLPPLAAMTLMLAAQGMGWGRAPSGFDAVLQVARAFELSTNELPDDHRWLFIPPPRTGRKSPQRPNRKCCPSFDAVTILTGALPYQERRDGHKHLGLSIRSGAIDHSLLMNDNPGFIARSQANPMVCLSHSLQARLAGLRLFGPHRGLLVHAWSWTTRRHPGNTTRLSPPPRASTRTCTPIRSTRVCTWEMTPIWRPAACGSRGWRAPDPRLSGSSVRSPHR